MDSFLVRCIIAILFLIFLVPVIIATTKQRKIYKKKAADLGPLLQENSKLEVELSQLKTELEKLKSERKSK